MGKPNLSYSGNHKVLIESFNDMSTINNLVPFSIRYADLCKFCFFVFNGTVLYLEAFVLSPMTRSKPCWEMWSCSNALCHPLMLACS